MYPATTSRRTALVLDDQAEVLTALQLIMEHAGFTVLTASSTDAAFEIWGNHGAEIDLLLSDYNLKDRLTGMDVADRFLATRPALKVIIVTAMRLDTQAMGLQPGVNFFQKPFDTRELITAARRLVEANSGT